jgi:Bacterial Ig domain
VTSPASVQDERSTGPRGGPRWLSAPGALQFIAVIGFALPVVAYIWFIDRYSINVIFRDQWGDIDVIRHSYNGSLSFGTLWATHYENRIFFPNLIVLVLSRVTHFNIVTEEYLSSVMLVVAIGLLIYAHKRRSPSTPWIYYCPVAILMLSFVQYGNTLWGFQMAWYLVLLSLAVTLVLLDGPKLTSVLMAAAMIMAVVGSFSSLQGLLIWPAGLVLLYHRRRPRAFVLAWLGVAVATSAVYFYGYTANGSSPEPYYAIQHPLTAIQFFLFAIGDVVGVNLNNFDSQVNVGVLLLGILTFLIAVSVVVAYGLRRDQSSGSPIGVALICFGMLFVASITQGRIWGGLYLASASKYRTFDLLILLGCYLVLLSPPTRRVKHSGSEIQTADTIIPKAAIANSPAHSYSGRRSALALLGARVVIGVVICLQITIGLKTGLEGARSENSNQALAARVLARFNEAPNALIQAVNGFEPASQVRELAQVAEIHHLSLFDSSQLAFFSKEGLPVDNGLPVTKVIYPAAGSRLKGTTPLLASAADEFGVTKVQFRITGGSLSGAIIATAKNTHTFYGWLDEWNTTTVPDGTYTLESVAYGATGDLGRSKGVAVVIANGTNETH